MGTISTIIDVAKAAGVSQRTASRILSGGSPRSKNASKVLEAARRLGYVRNQQAANLKSGFSRVIGVVVPNFDKPYHARLIQGLHDAFAKLEYPILVWCTDKRDDDRVTVLKRLLSYQVAGVFIDQTDHELDLRTRDLYQHFLAMNRPVIVSGTPYEEVNADYIHIDTQRAIAKLVKYHVRLGRKHLAFFAGPIKKRHNTRRFQFFKDELARLGVPFHEEYASFGEGNEESAYTRFVSMLNSSKQRPDAVVAANDTLAAGILRACHDENIRVPKDITVSGSDDTTFSRMLNPALTTMRFPMEAIVNDIAELMDYRIEKKDMTLPRVLKYVPELVVRESA